MALTTLTIRVQPETEKLFRDLFAECEPVNGRPPSMGGFLEELIENYQNPRKVEKLNAESIQRLNDLHAEAETLIIEKQQLQEKINELQRQLTESGVIPANKILFNVTDQELEVLEAIKTYLTAKGYDGTSEEALYVAIRHQKISR